MPDRLTLRDLNRATLARQMLLERVALPVTDGVERLIGLQAQQARPPFVGLWTRLSGFERADLAAAIDQRSVVKATMMRATLHLVAAADFWRLRAAIEPALAAAQESITSRRGAGDLSNESVLDLARPFLAESPRTFAEITAMFEQHMPDVDVGALRYTTRTRLPLVQVPTDTTWCYPGNPSFTLAEYWLGDPPSTKLDLRDLVMRYLAAYGPATVADIQTWSGMGKLKPEIEKFKSDLVVLRDERGREYLDAPDAPLPPAETPAPVRFLPEFDNILLAHKDRTRIVADEHRKGVYLPGLRVAATFLVDGFVAGAWKVEKSKGVATLTLDPFVPLDKSARVALADEAEPLVRFCEPDAKSYATRFTD